MRRPCLVAGIAALVMALTGGCDGSKAELEKARAELATVTAERDDLKTKLDQANAQVEALQKEVADLKEKAAPPEEAKPGATATKGTKKPARKPRRR